MNKVRNIIHHIFNYIYEFFLEFGSNCFQKLLQPFIVILDEKRMWQFHFPFHSAIFHL